MFSFNLDTSEILIYDEIGPGWWGLIDGASVIGSLAQMRDKHVTVRLNTPGGSVDEGIAIYNAMKSHPGGVTTIVDSLAASMGSYLLQAGTTRLVAPNSMTMIHDPWSISLGNASQLRKDADVLDKYAQRMIPDYAARSGKTVDEIKTIMLNESWYVGQEAVDAGFADGLATMDGAAIEPVVAGLRHIARNVPASLIQNREIKAGDRTPFPKREAAKFSNLRMTIAEARSMIARIPSN